jgi:hypothetical protein
MPRRPLDRRLFLASLAASAGAVPAKAIAAPMEDSLSGLTLPPQYAPPANMNAVMDMHSRMTAPVRVNGTGPYPFVVDTGSNQSVVADTLAAALGLQRGPVELVNGIAGAESAPTTSATLAFGNRTEADVILSILPHAAVGAVGMLGVDRLAGQRLTLDFIGARLSIEDARHVRRDPADIVMAAQARDGQLTLVDAGLAGVPVVAFLDSGAERTIGNLALRDRVTRRRSLIWAEVPVVSATGQTIIAQVGDLPSLRLGGMSLPYWPIAFASLHTFELWGAADKPALIVGVDVLSRFASVALDFLRSEVRFRAPESLSA